MENGQAEGQPVADSGVEQEKLLSQRQVNDLIRQEKDAARLRAQQDYEKQLQDYKYQVEELKSSAPKYETSNLNVDDVYNQVEQRLRDKFEREQREAEEAHKRQQMEQVASEYYRKIDSVKDKYPDFQAVMGEFNPKNFPEIVLLTSQMDNGGDVIYELAKYPEKLANVLSLVQRDPDLAKKRLAGLGKSINQNEQEAANYQAAPPPLSRMQSTHGGVNRPEPKTISDFKRVDWLRG